MKPTFFAKQSDFGKWLEKNHKKKTELLVGFHKIGSRKSSMSWSQSVDQALCFGWIDGIRKSIDENSYGIRFTPRKAGSIWSAINIKKVNELKRKRLMRPAGIASFEKRKENKSRVYSYEKEPVELLPVHEKKFKANKKAWAFFASLSPSYKKLAVHRVMDAKQEKTQISRLEKLIRESESGRKP
jgi:uncharacterized protein YdeI (YjbR/CyaY-like superfamily)